MYNVDKWGYYPLGGYNGYITQAIKYVDMLSHSQPRIKVLCKEHRCLWYVMMTTSIVGLGRLVVVLNARLTSFFCERLVAWS